MSVKSQMEDFCKKKRITQMKKAGIGIGFLVYRYGRPCIDGAFGSVLSGWEH